MVLAAGPFPRFFVFNRDKIFVVDRVGGFENI